MALLYWWGDVYKGDIVWSWFPNLPAHTRPLKPRPAIVLDVHRDRSPYLRVTVVYGTSQKLTVKYASDIVVTPYVWEGTGLGTITRFDFTQRLAMPWNDEYFTVPDWNSQLVSPILGRLPLGDSAFKEKINVAVRASNTSAGVKPAAGPPPAASGSTN